MQKGFHHSIMPRTLRDAAAVTRELGLRYLWVDSLCIIQDSDEDKSKEIRNMGDIYHGAFYTISATNSSSVYDGFLGHKLEEQDSIELPFPCPDVSGHTSGSIRVRRVGPYMADYDEPLNSRAWALQERLLSPRLLDYTSLHVAWRCRTTSHEYQDRDGKVLYPFRNHEPEKFLSLLSSSESMHLKDEAEILEIWEWVVAAYTGRDLTLEAVDKFHAIGAIAYFFSQQLRDEYVAGFWKRNLVRGILWCGYREPGRVPRRIKHSTSPSWSWMSMNGTIAQVYCSWDKGAEPVTFTLEILNYHIELVSPVLPFGPVTNGVLCVRGRLGVGFPDPRGYQGNVCVVMNGVPSTVFPDDLEEWEQNSPKGVTCLEVAKGRDPADSVPDSSGLCLVHLQGDCYRRIGFFSEGRADAGIARMFDRCEVEKITII